MSTDTIQSGLAVVTDRSGNVPAQSGTHSYTVDINLPNGRTLYGATMSRPVSDFWRNTPSIHTYPLDIGTPVPVTVIGEKIMPMYIEPPLIGECGAMPAMGFLERLILELDRASPAIRSALAARLAEEVAR